MAEGEERRDRRGKMYIRNYMCLAFTEEVIAYNENRRVNERMKNGKKESELKN